MAGFNFTQRNLKDNQFNVKNNNIDLKITILNVIEFTSARKMMSIFIKREDNENVIMLTKGADSVILPLSTENLPAEIIKDYIQNLDEYSKQGLRTLCIA